MKRLALLLCFVLLFSAWACTGKNGEKSAENPTEESPELIKDLSYSKGFKLYGIVSNEHGSRIFDYLYTTADRSGPDWVVAQWGNRFNLATTDEYLSAELSKKYPPCGVRAEDGQTVSFTNEGAELTVDMGGGDVTLGLYGSKLYEAPRKNGEAWPHLLLSQEYNRYMGGCDKIEVNFDFCIDEVVNAMAAGEYDEALHTAQFQLYFAITNRDKESAGYGETMWFGLSLYDYRYRDTGTDLYFGKDSGKEDSTGLVIYKLPSTLFARGNIEKKDVSVQLDIVKYLGLALDRAHREGYMLNTSYKNLYFRSMNVGWELQGTFDVKATIKNISVRLSDD